MNSGEFNLTPSAAYNGDENEQYLDHNKNKYPDDVVHLYHGDIEYDQRDSDLDLAHFEHNQRLQNLDVADFQHPDRNNLGDELDFKDCHIQRNPNFDNEREQNHAIHNHRPSFLRPGHGLRVGMGTGYLSKRLPHGDYV